MLDGSLDQLQFQVNPDARAGIVRPIIAVIAIVAAIFAQAFLIVAVRASDLGTLDVAVSTNFFPYRRIASED